MKTSSILSSTTPMVGKVFLIGAGPGDPELLTLKAARLIAEADVILVDDLVNREVLKHASPNVRLRYVGKRGGCRSTPQSFINRLMAHEAHKGHQVVRLKGGDALIFGRANEEIDFLHERGVPVELVAGITSAQAAGMALGRSLTDRAHSHGLVLLTGHPQKDGASIDYAALAQQGLTLVFYMGLARSELIQRDLLASGVNSTLPVAIVERASYADARVLRTTLGELSDCALQHAVQSPALLVLGQVAAVQNAHLLQEQNANLFPECESGFALSDAIAGPRLGAKTPSDQRVHFG
jgi:uroporphyrin-III C-methyltransferase